MTTQRALALVAAKTALTQVLADFPEDVACLELPGAISLALSDHEIDHEDLMLEGVDVAPGVVAVLGDGSEIRYDGVDVSLLRVV